MARLLFSVTLVLAGQTFAADSWDAPFPGVRHLHRTGAGNLNVHAVVVDLCHAGVSVRTTGFNERSQRTSQFAQGVGAQVAINADFFCRPVDVGPQSPFPPCVGAPVHTTYGVAAHAGAPWPGTLGLDAMLAFGADRARVFDDEEDQPFDPSWMSEVISGHWSIVRDGALLPNDCPVDPRTAVGLSRSRNSLIMAAADGRNGYRGMTCLEMGQLLIDLGADRGFALDSGGSTTFWMAGQGVVNHPSDGSERVVGSHLAVVASGQGRPPFCEQPAPQLNAQAPLPAAAPLGQRGLFNPVPPARLFDSRQPQSDAVLGGVARALNGLLLADTTFTLGALDRFSIPVDVTAVALNVTATDGWAEGYVTAWPLGGALPPTSTVNFPVQTAVANSALLSTVGAGVQFRASAPVHLIADLQGYFATQGLGYVPQAPRRLLDTRTDASGKLSPWVERQVVAPAAGVVRAVALNVTVTDAEGDGYLSVYPCGHGLPPVSNVNFVVRAPRAAMVLVESGAQGVCVYSNVAGHVVVDALGALVQGVGASLQPVAPVRWVDSRQPGGPIFGRTERNRPVVIDLMRAAQLPSDVRAVALNLTITNPLDDGYASVFPCSLGFQNTSTVNFVYGQTVPNQAIVPFSDGRVCVMASARTDFIIDVTGLFVGPATSLASYALNPSAQAQSLPTGWAAAPAAQVAKEPMRPSPRPVSDDSPVVAGCAATPDWPWLCLALLGAGALATRPRRRV